MFRLLRPPGRSLPLLLLPILAAGAHPAAAGTDRWTPLGPDGGTVQALAADPGTPGTVYAGIDGGGVWKSTDGGLHWLTAGEGLDASSVFALATAPGAPGTVWAATVGGIYKSVDGGASWHRVWAEGDDPDDGITPWTLSLAVDPADPDVVWAGTIRAWLLKTTDGGATWEHALESETNTRAVVIDPTDPARVYTNGQRTTDGGATWQEMDSRGHLLALNPADPRILYSGGEVDGIRRSDDAGATWSATSVTGSPESLLVDPSDPDIVLAGLTGFGLIRSEDGGRLWEEVPGLPFFLPALAADPAQPGRLWLGCEEQGVFRSLDAGRTWVASRQGLGATNVVAAAFDPFRPGTLYTSARNLGAHRSADGGATWNRINQGLPAGGQGVRVSTLAAHPSRPGILFSGTYEGAWRSLDRGAHWSRVLSDKEVRAFAFDPRRPGTLFAGGDHLSRSRDGGRTWKPLSLPRTSYDSGIAGLLISPLRPQTVFALDIDERREVPMSLLRSPDGGSTWKRVFKRGVAALASHPVLPGVLYLATSRDGEIWKSRDDGATWQKLAAEVGPGSALLVDRLDPSTLYLGTSGSGILRSLDGGVTWAPLNAGLTTRQITCLEADPRDPRHLVACTWGGGLQEIRLSSNP